MFRGPPGFSANSPVRPRQLIPDRPPLPDLPVRGRPSRRLGLAGQALFCVGAQLGLPLWALTLYTAASGEVVQLHRKVFGRGPRHAWTTAPALITAQVLEAELGCSVRRKHT